MDGNVKGYLLAVGIVAVTMIVLALIGMRSCEIVAAADNEARQACAASGSPASIRECMVRVGDPR